MATKLQIVTEQSQRLTMELAGRRGAWQSYLLTAARIYKYSFPDQLLIYGQRPEATACAPIEIWNKRMGRWVNAGAKGIALIDSCMNRPTRSRATMRKQRRSIPHSKAACPTTLQSAPCTLTGLNRRNTTSAMAILETA